MMTWDALVHIVRPRGAGKPKLVRSTTKERGPSRPARQPAPSRSRTARAQAEKVCALWCLLLCCACCIVRGVRDDHMELVCRHIYWCAAVTCLSEHCECDATVCFGKLLLDTLAVLL
jgi:hypothetical protein